MSFGGSCAPEIFFFVTRALIKIPCNHPLVLKVNNASEIQDEITKVLNEIDRLNTKGTQSLRKIFVIGRRATSIRKNWRLF